jgi:hypothetical protein
MLGQDGDIVVESLTTFCWLLENRGCCPGEKSSKSPATHRVCCVQRLLQGSTIRVRSMRANLKTSNFNNSSVPQI